MGLPEHHEAAQRIIIKRLQWQRRILQGRGRLDASVVISQRLEKLEGEK